MQKNISTDTTKKLSYADLGIFCEQLSLILGSGITVIEGFYVLQEESDDERTKQLFYSVISSLEEGVSLSDALEKTAVFPFYMIHMIKIGEVSGKLESVFHSLVTYYKREDNLRRSIKHSVTYPLAMVIMMLLVVGVLVVRVMPIFNSVFVQLGSEVSGFSRVLLDLGSWISDNIIVLVIIAAIVAVLVVLARFTAKGRMLFKQFKERSFLTKNLSDSIAVSRFAGGMSLMLSSGLDTDESLGMVRSLVDNEQLRDKIDNIKHDIEDGKPFATAMVENRIFSGVYARMLAVGFKTGSADEIMHSISQRYDEEVSRRLDNIVSVIEPTIVAVLSVIIGAILLSVMLPLMNIISQIG